MQNSYSEQDFFQSSTVNQGAGLSIDYRRILYRGIKYWYIILASLIITFSIAYLINRYSTKIYPIKASIIIKESQEKVGAKLLYNNPVVNSYRNFPNEMYIIKSFPLIKSVVDELGFDVSYFREGKIKTTEYYDSKFPIKVNFIGGERPYGRSFGFQILDEQTCQLKLFSVDETSQAEKVFSINFDDSTKINDFTIIVKKNEPIREGLIGKDFVIRFNDPSNVTKSYMSKLNALWVEQGASVVSLEVKGAIPSKEKQFLSKLIENYQIYDLEKKRLAASRSLEFIEAQLKVISDSLKLFEGQMERFKRKNVVTNLDKEAERLYIKLEGIENQKMELVLQKNYYDYLRDFLKKNKEHDQVVPPSSVGINDKIITDLIAQLVSLQMEVKLLSNGDENPLVRSKQGKLIELQEEILNSINVFEQTQLINLEFLNGQIRLVEQELALLPETERQLVNLKRNYSLQENLYIFLMQKRAEAGISKASTTSDIEEVNPPKLVSGAITPKVMQNYLIALLIGLVIPIGIFTLFEVFNTKIQSKDDIEKITTLPVTAGIGHNQSQDNLVANNKPKSSVAEAFRSLRSNLNYFTQSENKKVFLVTSSISGEGKSFTTINLSTVLAFSGKKTLIIGADMRKPKLYGDFGLTNQIGLSNYLAGMNSLEEIIQHTPIANLDLISAGSVPPNPSELLMQSKVKVMFDELLKVYDFIVLDTPPIVLVTDAQILSEYASHTIFLVRQNYTPKEVLRSTQELYQQGKIKNISILFNDIKKIGPGYGYGYAYGYAYKYGYKGQGYYNDES